MCVCVRVCVHVRVRVCARERAWVRHETECFVNVISSILLKPNTLDIRLLKHTVVVVAVAAVVTNIGAVRITSS